MSDCIRYACGNCGFAVEAWSDGNPYYFDDAGRKRHAHHPRHDLLERCVGNDMPHLCLGCGAEFTIDSRAPTAACPSCGSRSLSHTRELDGKTCPKCRKARFGLDPDFFAIS